MAVNLSVTAPGATQLRLLALAGPSRGVHHTRRMMTKDLARTLAMAGEFASGASDPWWIIGSAALVLHGARVKGVKDVDLLMSAPDAEALLRRVSRQPEKVDDDDRFRSSVFGTWRKPPLPVDIFGGFHLASSSGWSLVSVQTRVEVRVENVSLFVPSADELLRLLQRFGRPKDLERAQLLRLERPRHNLGG